MKIDEIYETFRTKWLKIGKCKGQIVRRLIWRGKMLKNFKNFKNGEKKREKGRRVNALF